MVPVSINTERWLMMTEGDGARSLSRPTVRADACPGAECVLMESRLRFLAVRPVLFLALFMIPVLADAAQGLDIREVPAMQAHTVPAAGERLRWKKAERVRLQMAANEYESICVLIGSPSRDLAGAQIAVSDFVSVDGGFSGEAVDIKHVLHWYQQAGAMRTHRVQKGDAVLVPELLVNDPELIRLNHEERHNYLKLSKPGYDNFVLISSRELRQKAYLPTLDEFPVRDADQLQPVDLKAGQNHLLWITFRVPDDMAPGMYRGDLSIRDADGELLERLDIEVEILPFLLDAPAIEYSLYYRGKLNPHHPTVSSEFKSEEQLRAELLDMREHGVRNPTVYQRYKPKAAPGPTSASQARRLLRRHLQLRKTFGMTGTPLYYLGHLIGRPETTEDFQRLARDVRDLRIMAVQFGFSEIYLYGIDEAKGEELSSQKRAWQTVQEAGGKVFAAGYKEHYERMGSLTDLLVMHAEPDPSEAAKMHGVGGRIFDYSNPQVGVEDPSIYRRNYGLLLWQADYDGAMTYAYQTSMGSTWNDFDHRIYRDLVFAYPTVDGVIGTVAWEGFREAVDDLRYLATLQRRIAATGSDAHARKEARDYLAALKLDRGFEPEQARARITELLRKLLEPARGPSAEFEGH